MKFQKKSCVAMILAGGQGSRLKVLTENTAKPAVPFGGKYRLIDFPLSNCVNSGIDTVGILTQYQPLQLNEYIGNGLPWGLNSSNGGIHVLSPYSKSESSEWYKGTANSIYQNLSFIERYNPSNVLILSGDHIYKMNYYRMLSEHRHSNADCTIAVIDVPIEEASRFGIMTTDENNVITAFHEKPEHPDSTKASMGIYIFKWEILKKYLTEDNQDPDSSNDFGKNIIPKLLADGRKLLAFEFSGYWKDVGTISSLWQANMDILGDEPLLNMREDEDRIYARNYSHPGSYFESGSETADSFIAEGSTVRGKVYNSVISTGCEIGKDAEIYNSVIMPNAVIGDGAQIKYSIIGEESVIGKGAVIGGEQAAEGEPEISVVGPEREVPEGYTILPGDVF